MMPESIREILRDFGRRNRDDIAIADWNYLKEFKLVKEEKNLLDGKMIWVLTGDGKKVQRFL